MPLDLSTTDLQRLSPAAVEARLLRMTQLVEGLGVGVEARRGFIHDFVIRLQAILGQAYSDQLDRVGRSLNPTLIGITGQVESTVIDVAANNLGLVRQQAATASGSLRITMSENRTVLIPAGTRFLGSNGVEYVTSQVFVGRSEATEVRSLGDRVISLDADGNYSFTIEAAATTTGFQGQLQLNSTLQPVSIVIANLVSVTAASDFDGGQDAESDAALIDRMRRLLPARTASTRASISAYLSQPQALPQLRAISTLGFGDEELVRAQRAGLGSASMADVFIRSSLLPSLGRASLTGTVTEVVPGGSATWSIPVGRDIMPGFYRVVDVRNTELTNIQLAEVQRGMDVSALSGEYVPRITEPQDAAFSRFQTAVLIVTSSSTGLTVGQQKTFEVDLQGLPSIAAAQSLLSDRAFRYVGGDTLVRAAVPAFVSVAVQLHVSRGNSLPSPLPIRSAIADYINNAGFAGRLHKSRISSLVHRFLPAGIDVASIEVVLETLKPTGQISRQRVSDHIEVPLDIPAGVSARTCVFFADPANISISAFSEPTPTIA